MKRFHLEKFGLTIYKAVHFGGNVMNKMNLIGRLEMAEMRKLLFILPLLFLTSCMVIGPVFHDEDVEKLEAGMTEQKVIEILGAKPTARSKHSDGSYLLQWIYNYVTDIGVSGGRHIAILFSSEGKMIEIKYQYQTGTGL